jgi:hypothetical protein
MTGYTRGPWAVLPVEADKDYTRIRGTRLGGRYKVANVLEPVYDGAPDREADETRANASLIAAAPELLEALIDVMGWIPGGTFWHTDAPKEAMEKARAAIRKAIT